MCACERERGGGVGRERGGRETAQKSVVGVHIKFSHNFSLSVTVTQAFCVLFGPGFTF